MEIRVKLQAAVAALSFMPPGCSTRHLRGQLRWLLTTCDSRAVVWSRRTFTSDGFLRFSPFFLQINPSSFSEVDVYEVADVHTPRASIVGQVRTTAVYKKNVLHPTFPRKANEERSLRFDHFSKV